MKTLSESNQRERERLKGKAEVLSVKYYWRKNVQKILREYVCIAMREVV